MADRSNRSKLWMRIALRVLLLVAGGISLNLLAPRILDVLGSAPRLSSIEPLWFPLMAGLEAGSFAAAWQLTRVAIPGISWFVAATAQLAGNAASRALPGGAVVGGAVAFRMWSRSGVETGNAAAALTANSVISNLVLLALPAVAAIIAAVTAPVPKGLLPVAVGGAAVFAVVFAAGATAAAFDRPLLFVGKLIERIAGWVARLRGRHSRFSASRLVEERDEVVEALGPRWKVALGAASANWLLDYLVLFFALVAVGAEPRLSLVLLAYGAAALLSMIPITPGGLGFVEVGLTATLTAASIPVGDALVATLAYRIFSYWLPIPLGALAYGAFRLRIG